MIRLLAHPLPLLSRQQVVSLSQSSCVSPVKLNDRRGREVGWRGAKSYDREKAWSSINHSILSEWSCSCLFQWARTVLIVERGIPPKERLRQQDLYRYIQSESKTSELIVVFVLPNLKMQLINK
jgi:hypothetical protein